MNFKPFSAGAVLIFAVLILVSAPSFAGEKLPGEKSMTLGIILGLPPVAGDGLMYAGKWTQGGIALGLEVAAVVTNVVVLTRPDSEISRFQKGVVVAAATGPVILATWLWDLIGTTGAINTHNKKIRGDFERQSFLKRIEPELTSSAQGTIMIGLKGNF